MGKEDSFMSSGKTSAEHPILMNGLMVRAILDGYKTQTRRLVKPQPTGMAEWWTPKNKYLAQSTMKVLAEVMPSYCPYGRIGDTLWVRETWQMRGLAYKKPADAAMFAAKYAFHYRATDNGQWKPYWGNWRPSIHMPRAASRITLEITGIKVERLQDITKEDVIAEGFSERDGQPIADVVAGWHEPFAQTWNSINALPPNRWENNPWVWVISFQRT